MSIKELDLAVTHRQNGRVSAGQFCEQAKMNYKLLYGTAELGHVREDSADFPSFFGTFELSPAARADERLQKVMAYYDYSKRVWPLIEDDRMDEIAVEEETVHAAVIESDDWSLEDERGERTPILVPVFCTDGGINWRLNSTR